MESVSISSEFIKLDQFLKWANLVNSGVEAKFLISEGLVKVNGETEMRRGKKLIEGDIIDFDEKRYKVVRR